MPKKGNKELKRFRTAKKVLGAFREIGMSPSEAQTVMLILMTDDIHRIAEKLAGKDE